jgi:Ser/Thr protein kinase RdoA (MazF antagonist)
MFRFWAAQVIHGDWHRGNILLKDDKNTATGFLENLSIMDFLQMIYKNQVV